MRYSLASLFAAVLFVALGCLALVKASALVRDITISVTVALLIVATHAAFFADGRWRAFAAGFGVTGWMYFVMTFGSFFSVSESTGAGWDIRRGLLTERVVKWGYVAICDARQSADPYRGWTAASEDPNILLRPIEETHTPADNTKDLTRTLPNGNTYREWDITWGPPPGTVDFVDQNTFSDVGHSLWTLLLGAAGGWFAVILRRRAQSSAQKQSHDPAAADDQRLAGHEA